MHPLWALNERKWFVRLPTKALVLAATVFFVCFPYPALFWRNIARWRNPMALIEPHAPALQPWVDELQATLPPGAADRRIVKHVEAFVYDHVPYAWDWDNWGVSDYIPTVSEVVERGKEDCDGRAVVAASLMVRFGVSARLVSDFAHVWVTTAAGDAMGPGQPPAMVSTDRGLKIRWSAVPNLGRACAFGIAVFPWPREAIVLIVLWILMLRRGGGFATSVLPGVGLAMGLWALRAGGIDYWRPVSWLQPAGAMLMVGSAIALRVCTSWWIRRTRSLTAAGSLPM